jgi:hypothetical protein
MIHEILSNYNEVHQIGELDVDQVLNVDHELGDDSPREGKENEEYRDTGRYNPPPPEEESQPAPGAQSPRKDTGVLSLLPRAHLSALLDELKALSNW